jgi:hypothetical protein
VPREDAALELFRAHAMQCGGVSQHLRDNCAPGLRVVAQLHLDHHRAHAGLDGQDVNETAAEQDLPPQHDDPRDAAEREKVGTVATISSSVRSSGNPVGANNSQPSVPSDQIAVTNYLPGVECTA